MGRQRREAEIDRRAALGACPIGRHPDGLQFDFVREGTHVGCYENEGRVITPTGIGIPEERLRTTASGLRGQGREVELSFFSPPRANLAYRPWDFRGGSFSQGSVQLAEGGRRWGRRAGVVHFQPHPPCSCLPCPLPPLLPSSLLFLPSHSPQ